MYIIYYLKFKTMKNLVKNGFYGAAWIALIGLNSANAAVDLWGWNVDSRLKWTETTIDKVIQNWLAYLVTFLYLVAIIMMIWWAFNVLTAGGDEEKEKKWKTILMQAVAWIIVVFIANSVISWVITWLFGAAG